VGGRDQLPVGGGDIAVGDHGGRGDDLAVGKPDPGGAAVLDDDLLHRRAAAHLGAEVAQQPLHRLDQRVHPAHGEVDPLLALQVGDDAVDGAGAERVATDEERVEGEDGAQARVVEVTRGEAVDALGRAEAEQLRDDAGEGAGRQERLAGQVGEGAGVDALGCGEEAPVAGHVARVEAGDLLLVRFRPGPVVEPAAVREEESVEGAERHQGQVGRARAAGSRPEVVEELRGGDEGGAHVEGEARLAMLGGAAAEPGACLDQGHGVPGALQADRGGQAAEAAADDDDARRTRVAHGCKTSPATAGRYAGAGRDRSRTCCSTASTSAARSGQSSTKRGGPKRSVTSQRSPGWYPSPAGMIGTGGWPSRSARAASAAKPGRKGRKPSAVLGV